MSVEAPFNQHLIGAQGGSSVVVMLPIVGPLTAQEAAGAAAWLATMAELVDPSVDFDAIRAAVRSS